MERFGKIAAEALGQVLNQSINPSDLETPPDPKMGDFAFPCFRLAKELRSAPPKIAGDLAQKVAALPSLAPLTVKAVGPYVNFTVPDKEVLQKVIADILSPGPRTYGEIPPGSRGKWVMEFSSPNIAKPFMAGHMRPTALGAALCRIGSLRGFEMISINHLGDWGTQWGKLAVAYALYGNEIPENPTVNDLVGIYVKFHEAAEKNPELEDRAREAFVKLENGDEEILKLWRKCVDVSMPEFMRLYKKLGIDFTYYWGESHYVPYIPELLKKLSISGLMVESEGAQVVPVTDDQGKEIPPCILQKKDGATIYATRDVAAAEYRWDKFHFDRMSYIVGSEQKLHFQQVFGVLRRMGHEWVSKLEHIPTGLYRMRGGKMSTRKGQFVTLEDVMSLARERVSSLMDAREADRNLTAEEKAATIEAVAIGAVVFHDISTDPARDVEFDVEKVVDFEGETGPYLQYAHTRCLSMLRKAQTTEALAGLSLEFDAGKAALLVAPQEGNLAKVLGQFPYHLDRSLQHRKASQLASYLIQVTKAFNSFYRECRVITPEEPALSAARLMLVEATRRILSQGLTLVGVPLPEKM